MVNEKQKSEMHSMGTINSNFRPNDYEQNREKLAFKDWKQSKRNIL